MHSVFIKTILIISIGISPAVCPHDLFAKSKLKVDGIIMGKEPTAIINGRVAKVGDTIEGVKVVEITNKAVRFSDEVESSSGSGGDIISFDTDVAVKPVTPDEVPQQSAPGDLTGMLEEQIKKMSANLPATFEEFYAGLPPEKKEQVDAIVAQLEKAGIKVHSEEKSV